MLNIFSFFRQKSRQILYDFKGTGFYLKFYVLQTTIKIIVCSIVFGFCVFHMCMYNLRESFKITFDCKVFDYVHGCTIPSNGLNMIIFDIVCVVLALIIILGIYNVYWHWQFRGCNNLIINKIQPNGLKNPISYARSKVSKKTFVKKVQQTVNLLTL